MAPTFTLRTVTSAGELDRYLPDYESLDLSPIFCQAGTVTFKYPENGVGFDLLTEDTEIAVQMDGVEISQLRCIIEEISGENAAETEDATLWSFNCRTMMAQLDQAVVYPKNWPATQPPTHDFVSATPGKILGDLLNKAKARGALALLTWDFTDLVDSTGRRWDTWAEPFDISFDAGATYSDVVQTMFDSGLLEVRTEGRTLRAFVVETLGTDRSVGVSSVRFTKGRDLEDSPRKISTRDVATTVLMGGAENAYAEQVSDSAQMSTWGRRETYYSANNISNSTFLRWLGLWVVGQKNEVKREVTHGLLFEDESSPRPIRDFDIGDWTLSDVGQGWERYRIKQWVVSVKNTGEVSGSVVLNDLFAEREQVLSDRLRRLSNGSASPGASEEKDDGKTPAAPGGLTLTTDYYVDYNVSRASVTADWDPVTTNTDGSLLTNLSGYRVRWRYSSEASWRSTVTLDSDETAWAFAGIWTDRVVQVQVQAFNKYNRNSSWSALGSITTARDTIPPAKPEPPKVVSRVGTLRMTWSGLDYQGQEQVADYAGVEVHVGPNGTFTPTSATRVDFLNTRSPSSITLGDGLSYGTEYWVRLVAIDTNGNRSDPSDETSTSHAVLTPVVSLEIGSGQVGLNNTRFSDIGNLVEDGSFENTALRVSRQLAMGGTRFYFDNTTSSNGYYSIGVNGLSGAVDQFPLQVGLPVKPGERIFGAADFRMSPDTLAVAELGVVVKWYDRDRQIILPAGGADYETLTRTYNPSNPLPRDGQWYPRVVLSSRTAPAGATTFDIYLVDRTHSTGTIWIDAIEVRRQVDTLMIGTAVIQSAHIGLLQVNDAHMANVSIGKLTAGNLLADMTVSARIKTSDTGARVEINSAGLQAWNTGGVQTVDISGSTGSASFVGQIKSGSSGRRVEVNSSFLPEIRFYPSSGSNYGFMNATSVAGPDTVYVGLNSGQFDVDGTATTYRLYLTDGGGGAHFHTINSANQSGNGGRFVISPTLASGVLTAGGRDHSFMRLYKDGSGGGIGATIGHDGTTDSTDSWTEYRQDGTIKTVGRFENIYAPSSNQALVFMEVGFSTAIGGFEWNWGATGLSVWYPQLQVRDNAAHAAALSSLNNTGFITNYDVASAGSSACHFMAWRA